VSYILAIYDKETDYANQLMDFIKRKQKHISQVRVFTNENSLKEYLDHDRIDVLLLNESIPTETVQHDNIKNICVLSEGNYIRESTGYPVIYKFQSAELVMQEIFSYFPFNSENSPYNSTNSKLKIISVYSITRDTEKMAFSLSLAKQYAKQMKTLYINLDVFQALSEPGMGTEEKGLSEFIYYLKQNPPNLITKMNKIIQKDNNLDYIQGVTFGPDLYELTADDILQWLQEIKKSTEYEMIIFNVGCFFQAILELFRSSSQLIYLLGENNLEKAKYHNFKNQLLWAGFDEVIDRMKIISISEEEEERYQSITIEDLYSEVIEEFAYRYVKGGI
jgi:hypothetical protein